MKFTFFYKICFKYETLILIQFVFSITKVKHFGTKPLSYYKVFIVVILHYSKFAFTDSISFCRYLALEFY